jgi:hypothetical protein
MLDCLQEEIHLQHPEMYAAQRLGNPMNLHENAPVHISQNLCSSDSKIMVPQCSLIHYILTKQNNNVEGICMLMLLNVSELGNVFKVSCRMV